MRITHRLPQHRVVVSGFPVLAFSAHVPLVALAFKRRSITAEKALAMLARITASTWRFLCVQSVCFLVICIGPVERGNEISVRNFTIGAFVALTANAFSSKSSFVALRVNQASAWVHGHTMNNAAKNGAICARRIGSENRDTLNVMCLDVPPFSHGFLAHSVAVLISAACLPRALVCSVVLHRALSITAVRDHMNHVLYSACTL